MRQDAPAKGSQQASSKHMTPDLLPDSVVPDNERIEHTNQRVANDKYSDSFCVVLIPKEKVGQPDAHVSSTFYLNKRLC